MNPFFWLVWAIFALIVLFHRGRRRPHHHREVPRASSQAEPRPTRDRPQRIAVYRAPHLRRRDRPRAPRLAKVDTPTDTAAANSAHDTCGICGRPVDRGLRLGPDVKPHPLSPEIDEIVPFSLGRTPLIGPTCGWFIAHVISDAGKARSGYQQHQPR